MTYRFLKRLDKE